LMLRTVASLRPMALATPRTSPPMSVRSAACSRDAIHPIRQRRNGMLVQSTYNTARQPKVRRHLEGRQLGVLSWIVFGLIAGIIAKLLMPGRDPGGCIITMLLGVAGAFVGGFLYRLVTGTEVLYFGSISEASR
jgi:uncharacterized membrane protein YeaQ/YmgE (transglycosylase-associated protein family)